MTKDPIQRTKRLAIIAFVLCIANCMRYLNLPSLRAVEVISFIALGMSAGAIVTTMVAARKVKQDGHLSSSGG